jgi:membrane protease YdiL (CAAX protease family)
VVLVVIGWYSTGLHNNLLARTGGRSLMWLPLWGFLWGLLQQYVLQAFVNRRSQIALGQGWRSILLVAAVFALLHFPNPWLSLITFAGGLVWAWVYQRAPNLPALALSHSLMTLVLIWTLPPALLNGLRVGFNYFG